MLFDAPLMPGLRYAEEAISAAEEEQLIERLLTADLTPFKFQGWTGNRKTRSFGWRYDFDDASFARTEPIPPWLEPLQERAGAFAQLEPRDFVHVLVARYDPGAGIGWHRDRDVFDRVVGFSFAAPAILRFRRRKPSGFDRAKLSVAPRSAYLLSDEARTAWEHSIAPGDQLRFSITFRTLSDKGRKIAIGQA
jgi:alkylated DNA repair dioxygenase AlkB